MENPNHIIAQFIAKGATEDALRTALGTFPHLSSEIVILQGKYNNVKKRHLVGAMDMEKYNIFISEISFDLLDMLDEPKEKAETANKTPMKRLISFQKKFFTDVISEFSRSKIILLTTLAFIIIVGVTSIIFITHVMPTFFGKITLGATLVAFFTLIISSIGFMNIQIKQFKGTQSFLKFQEHSEES